MESAPLLRHVLQDEGLTRGLGDVEARMLVEWLVDWAELLADIADTEEEAWRRLRGLCKRARAIGRFVSLWADRSSRGAASQLAATERFSWPLPAESVDPGELMGRILDWESRHLLN
jgi:hypothetical protein